VHDVRSYRLQDSAQFAQRVDLCERIQATARDVTAVKYDSCLLHLAHLACAFNVTDQMNTETCGQRRSRQ
jgi:hypothetical protein